MVTLIVGNRIRSIARARAGRPTGMLVDASALTAMPGLIEFRLHTRKALGEALIVKRVIANGRVYPLDDLIEGRQP